MTALAQRFEVAQAICTEAAALAVSMQPLPGDDVGTLKGPQDWVTEADGAVERFLSERIEAAFPEDGFQGEEGGVTRTGSLRWVVDPIDGTSNYAHGASRWAVSIGLLDDRTPLLGVLVAPRLGDTYTGYLGHGATLNGYPIRAAATATLARATVECGWSGKRSTREFHALCGRVMDSGCLLRSGGSGALGLAEVAAGLIDGYVELQIHLWDVAAALAVLAESGAVVSGFMYRDGPVKGGPILAAAPGIAHALRAVAALPE